MERLTTAQPRGQKSTDGNTFATETALHRTRLHDLDLKIFAKEFMRKPPRQPAPPLGFRRVAGLALSASNCNVVQKIGRSARLTDWLTWCFKKDLLALREDRLRWTGGGGVVG